MSGTSEGTLLGGLVRYVQFRDGHRTGIEPVLLAAFVPARPGERVIEGGTGAGAGLLCLAARVPGIEGIGIEADPRLAALANGNFAVNGFEACRAETVRLPALPDGARNVSHAFANPPWHDPAGTRTADRGRLLARHRSPGLIAQWALVLGAALARGGTLSMIVPASLHLQTAQAIEAAGCGAVSLFPLWPRAGRPARLVMLQGVRGSRAPPRVLPGLVLHDQQGFTKQAESVLRRPGQAAPDPRDSGVGGHSAE